MACTSLFKYCSIVGYHQQGVCVVVVVVLSVVLNTRQLDASTKVVYGAILREELLHIESLTFGQTRKYVQCDPRDLDFLKIDATVQQLFVVPSPISLPESPWIHGKGIENHDERRNATIGGFRLGGELFRQNKITFATLVPHRRFK
jgi:hypothetical protein